MIRFTMIVVALMGSASSTLAQECKVTKQSKNKVHTPQVVDKVGHCGHFALRALLHERRCQDDPKNCVLPSVADVIAQLGVPLRTYPFPSMKSVNDENCVSYDEVYPSHTSLDPNTSPLEAYTIHYEKLAESLPASGRGADFESVKQQLRIPRLSQQQGEALFTHFSQWAEKKTRIVSQKNKCRARPLPALQSQHISFNDYPQLFSTLDRELDRGNKVMVGLTKLPLPAFLKSNEYWDHAIVIANYKVVCCAGVCTRYYQTIDSLENYWSPGRQGTWVPESDIRPHLFPALNWYGKPGEAPATPTAKGQPTEDGLIAL